ncbi:TetR/AcrR family transcriptional regulator [Rubrobacter aplysinae]|uniref:TetR/AcrR family transcriptional regulator n=1 Tax=Rubrobacter aplysinae TaxID=909625 RepID=UPI00064BB7D4|nr:TetR/AcrR family transcriptional regulator [Rubrobacter aplysinae]
MARPADPGKRERILETARAVFVEDGYDGARMTRIASGAGVAVGTLYLYFDSKDALAVALTDQFFEKVSHRVKPMLADLSSPESIGRIVDSALEIASEERDLFKIERLPERSAHSFREEMARVFSERLQSQIGSGAINDLDAPVVASLLISLIESAIYECLVWETKDLYRYREALKWTFTRLLLGRGPDGS